MCAVMPTARDEHWTQIESQSEQSTHTNRETMLFLHILDNVSLFKKYCSRLMETRSKPYSFLTMNIKHWTVNTKDKEPVFHLFFFFASSRSLWLLALCSMLRFKTNTIIENESEKKLRQRIYVCLAIGFLFRSHHRKNWEPNMCTHAYMYIEYGWQP